MILIKDVTTKLFSSVLDFIILFTCRTDLEFLQRITTEVRDKGNINTIRPLNLWENKLRKHYVDFVWRGYQYNPTP